MAAIEVGSDTTIMALFKKSLSATIKSGIEIIQDEAGHAGTPTVISWESKPGSVREFGKAAQKYATKRDGVLMNMTRLLALGGDDEAMLK